MVNLVDDNLYEEDEEFRLVLGTPKSKSPFGASTGEQSEAMVTITDEKDSKLYPRNTERYLPHRTSGYIVLIYLTKYYKLNAKTLCLMNYLIQSLES